MKKILYLLIFCSLNSYALEMGSEISSPINTDAWKIIAIGTVATGTSLLLKDITIHQATHEIANEKPLGKHSKIGDIMGQLVPNFIYATSYGIASYANNNQEYQDNAVLMVKATAYSGLTANALKRAFNATRPNGGRHSFPSGHSTTAFAFASVVYMRHENIYAKIGAMTLASFVGLSRINDKKHFVHDVIAGAAIGSAYGVGLALQLEDKKTNIIPIVNKDTLGMAFSLDF